ncbi:RDD family protein [Kineosporia sp. R_H_3]|uniref:RDD family protein n=1 Tax=Kineosporia sp. R_H_3 TaxID=1961848 RepID=UPI00130463B5|nr:RDD family protein [Kineosporia sp. R_H_3]
MSPSRPPGWYTDSADPARERWWDGGEWSHVTRPGPERPAPAGRSARPAPAPSYGTPGPGRQGYEQGYGQGYEQDPAQGYGPPGQGPYAQWRPMPFAGPTTPDGVPLAAPGVRLVARFLDYLITSTVSAVVGLPFLLPFVSELQDKLDASAAGGARVDVVTMFRDMLADPELTSRLVGFQIVSLLVSGLYTVLLVRFKGATVGKLAAGVRVRGWDREGRPTWTQALARWVTREGVQVVPYVGGLYWLLDSVWLLWDPRRQALHDKAGNTVVVRSR